jgi:hypothetical protein
MKPSVRPELPTGCFAPVDKDAHVRRRLYAPLSTGFARWITLHPLNPRMFPLKNRGLLFKRMGTLLSFVRFKPWLAAPDRESLRFFIPITRRIRVVGALLDSSFCSTLRRFCLG